jgi:hypothetical protein
MFYTEKIAVNGSLVILFALVILWSTKKKGARKKKKCSN